VCPLKIVFSREWSDKYKVQTKEKLCDVVQCNTINDISQSQAQGYQVADLPAIFADFGRMKKLLAEWKNPIRPLPKVAESGLIESISAKLNN
jgi:hypothetical protein